MISAKEANHKFAVETKLLTDKETINYIVKRNKTFGEKIVNGINRMIQRKIGSKEQKFLAGIRTKWEAALEESRKEGDKKRPSEDIAYSETEEIRYAFGKSYENIVDEIHNLSYDPEKDGEYIIVSTHLPQIVLKRKKGIKDAKLIIYYKKLYRVMEKRPKSTNEYYDEEKDKGENFHNLGVDFVKKIPEYLVDPEYILEFEDGRINIIASLPEKYIREYRGEKRKDNLFVSIEFNCEKIVENKYGKYHMILTVFPSNMDYLNKQINKSTKTLYDKKKESADVPDTRRRNSTGSLDITDSNKSISEPAEKVNREKRKNP